MKGKLLLIIGGLLLASCSGSTPSSIISSSVSSPVTSSREHKSSEVSSIEHSSKDSSEISSSLVSESSSAPTTSFLYDEITKEQFFDYYKANEEARTKLYKKVNVTLMDFPAASYDLNSDDKGEYAVVDISEFDLGEYSDTLGPIEEFDFFNFSADGEEQKINVYVMMYYSAIEEYISQIEVPEGGSLHFFHHNGLTKNTNNLEIKGSAKTPEELMEFFQSDTFDFEFHLDIKNYIRGGKITVNDPKASVVSTYEIDIYPSGTK